ncbi:MAG: hypothetical protein NW205_01170 [Hyphomicrobiaceae bacterium]|nr:hypothetical protein [Hyphomicrobiaceae bacterium]
MFDLGRIGDLVGSLIGTAVQERVGAAGLDELLAQAGIDPADLAGLDQAQIVEYLAGHGIDASLLEGIDLAAWGQTLSNGSGAELVSEAVSRFMQR